MSLATHSNIIIVQYMIKSRVRHVSTFVRFNKKIIKTNENIKTNVYSHSKELTFITKR